MDNQVDQHDSELYVAALSALHDHDIRFMLGGAFAVYHYTNWWRNTHDIDVYTTLEYVEEAKNALRAAGFCDLGEQAQHDREWIYHAGTDSMIVDVIWRFANLINYVTPDWFDRAPRGQFLGVDVTFLPLEELVWLKSFVINRHRCDWPDVIRILRSRCENVDWPRLLGLVGENWLLLAGMIDVFDWQHPGWMHCIPDHVRQEFAERRKVYRANPINIEREHLLDPWLHLRADTHAIWRNE